MKTAVALGGGGARGIAHIGVLKALVEAEIFPDLVVGTSMGSVAGAMYAQSGDPEAAEKRLREYLNSDEFGDLKLKTYHRNSKESNFFGNAVRRLEERIIINLSISQSALFKKEHFIEALEFLLGRGLIEDTRVKFAAVAGDLISGKKVVMDSGDILTAVLASSSIPAFLPPVDYGGMRLVDGEVVELIPCETARELGGGFIIAVDVRQNLQSVPPLENALDILFRAGQIRSHGLSNRIMKADVVIKPEVDKFHWTEFEQIDPILKAGYVAGKSKVDEIRARLRIRKWQFWRK